MVEKGPRFNFCDPSLRGTSNPLRPAQTYQLVSRQSDPHVSDFDLTAQIETGTPPAQPSKAGVTAGPLLVRGDRS